MGLVSLREFLVLNCGERRRFRLDALALLNSFIVALPIVAGRWVMLASMRAEIARGPSVA
jgi:hypothetical protein